MHLFGLNWQLQDSGDSYGSFENGGGGGASSRDTTPNTFMVSTDNSESDVVIQTVPSETAEF